MNKSRLFVGVLLLSMYLLPLGACASQAPSTSPSPSLPVTASPKPSLTPVLSPGPSPSATPGRDLLVYFTDAAPSEQVTSIVATISEVQILKDDGGWVTLKLGKDASTFDLLKTSGVERFAGTTKVQDSKYTQVRLVMGAVRVALGGGALQDIKPTDSELKIAQSFNLVKGDSTALVIDFDAQKMVTVTEANKITVQPVAQVSIRPGSISKAPMIDVAQDDFKATDHVVKQGTVPVGDTFCLALYSNLTTGFKWSEEARISDPTIVQQIGYAYISYGASGKQIFTFGAISQGTTTIRMECSQPQEGGAKTQWIFDLTLVVK